MRTDPSSKKGMFVSRRVPGTTGRGDHRSCLEFGARGAPGLRGASVVFHRSVPTPGHEAGVEVAGGLESVRGWDAALLTRSAFAWCLEPVQ
jgi:hypothetical protein